METDSVTAPRPTRRRIGRFARRFVIALLVFAVFFFFGLRWVEFLVTFHPTKYSAAEEKPLPSNAEEVWFVANDGIKLHGRFIRAAVQPARATVMYLHGNAGTIHNVEWIGESLAAADLDVLIFDYRGYGRSEGAVKDEWGINTDADAAYDFLVKDRHVKPEKLALYGQSLGTTAAADVCSRRPCGALIMESGLSSASDMGHSILPWLPRWLHFLGKNRFESARKLASVKCPVLIVHGTSDEFIPVSQAKTLYESAHDPKRLLLIPGAPHFIPGPGGPKYLDQIRAYLEDVIRAN